MMMLREHEFSDRRLSEPSYSVAPISLMDPTVCIAMTGVDQCLWLSVVLVILVHDSWVNRLVYILRENSNCTEESTGYWVIHSGISLFIRIRLWALIDLTF
ncbi:hypothetical protein Naga_100433g3 [Nannochloropsis gaditana]|uniref:Uncharacterized protein n=1 Tax=Nannochloropsis gaditana TaxID=72520 RepID=W7TB01_9STRA|nr:hypothetical protein Naga_100433g3 [Nannochloropsis gaditana]